MEPSDIFFFLFLLLGLSVSIPIIQAATIKNKVSHSNTFILVSLNVASWIGLISSQLKPDPLMALFCSIVAFEVAMYLKRRLISRWQKLGYLL